jgi:hypothetical protein
MLKKRHTYENYNDEQVTEDFYFNLTRSELAENLWIKTKVDNLGGLLEGEQRTLNPEDVAKILEVVKDFMRISYGVKSADGKRFVKSPELWTEFEQSAAYDSLLFSLFENPEEANNFIVGVMPKQLAEAAEKMKQAQAKADNNLQQAGNLFDKVETEKQEPTIKELNKQVKDPKDMTREELLEAFKQKTQG